MWLFLLLPFQLLFKFGHYAMTPFLVFLKLWRCCWEDQRMLVRQWSILEGHLVYPRVIPSPMCVPRAASLRRLVVAVTAEVSRCRHHVFHYFNWKHFTLCRFHPWDFLPDHVLNHDVYEILVQFCSRYRWSSSCMVLFVRCSNSHLCSWSSLWMLDHSGVECGLLSFPWQCRLMGVCNLLLIQTQIP